MDSRKPNLKLFLAPMEGVGHYAFRKVFSDIKGPDFFVSEFIRITDQLHSKKVFYRFAPELKQEKSTYPLAIQLLGSNSEFMLLNARRAIELGTKHIDINFGCPAKLVNKNFGGAYLLQFPDQIFNITNTIRKNIPKEITVSAKIRLGYQDTFLLKDICQSLDDSKIDWITVHCRTKKNGYAPPAYWEFIPQIRNWTDTPIVVNGDIFSLENFIECFKKTACEQFMIGRGAIQNPFIFHEIKNFVLKYNLNDWIEYSKKMSPEQIKVELNKLVNLNIGKTNKLLFDYYNESEMEVNGYYATAKIKGWLKYLAIKNQYFKKNFDSLKTLKYPNFISEAKNLFKENE